jgi:ADP-heptose:LPS heptosyltransferase
VWLNLPRSTEEKAEAALPEGNGSVIAAAPGSRWPMKKWPVQRYRELLDRLTDRYRVKVVILGDERDREEAAGIAAALGKRALDLTGRTSVLEAASYLKRTRAFIGNDSGLMHLAELVGVPVLALFGPTTEAFGYYPSLPGSKVCERELSCRPCSRNGSRQCYKIFPGRRQECLAKIEVAAVEKAFDDLMAGEGPRRYLLP